MSMSYFEPQQLAPSHKKIAKPSSLLFDRIISAITQEKEFKQTKKLLYLFVSLLVLSVAVMPFSLSFFMNQWKASGMSYFIVTAFGNMGIFFSLWQDVTLSLLESLPVMGITVFAINVALLLFTARLFLYKKGLLLRYMRHSFTVR